MALVNDTQLQYFATSFYGKVKANFDAKGSADTAETNAKAYADGLNTTMDTRVDALETTVGDASNGLVKDVAILKGDDQTVGSVAYQIAQIVAGADASFDTLKEIADWIINDTIGATQMGNDIAGLKTLVGTLPQGITSTNVVDYIAEYVEAQLTASDLSQYAKATDFNALKAVVGDASNGLVKDVADVTAKATANESAIAKLNDADTVEGSVKKAVKDGVAEAKGYTDTKDSAMDARMVVVEGKATANETAIGVLNGADTVVGSVAKALKDAKDYTDTKDTAMGARVTAVETAIGKETDDVHGVVASGIYARLEALEATMTNDDIDAIINGLA